MKIREVESGREKKKRWGHDPTLGLKEEGRVCSDSCPGGYQVGIEYMFFWDSQQGGSRATLSPQQLWAWDWLATQLAATCAKACSD